MALGKTIQYTPFEETSFGYGVGEIASAHSTEFPNGTDIVKLIITNFGGNWDNNTGHVSTPKVGTATAAYNKAQDQWAVAGQRDDVDAVLADLKFFPSDYAAARTWTPTAVLPNVTSGSYPMDEPSYVASIPDTTMSLYVYDVNDTLIQSYQVIWDAIDPVYGNQRPYWSVEPQTQDVSGVGYDTVAGWTLDFGKISHGSDTENVTVSCELRELGGSSPVSTRGSFTEYDNMYVGDKKPDVYTSGSGFSFTGSVEEAQAFFDTVRYSRSSNTNKLTAEMYLKVGDGVLASAFTEYLYSSDKAPEFTTFPAQATTEETDLTLDTTGFSLVNTAEFPSTDVNLWTAEISIDATGQSGIANCSEPITNGVITINSSSISNLISTIGTITFTFEPDFNDEWTFELDITATDNLYALVSWTSAQQTVNVSIADVPEYAYPNVPPTDPAYAISWNEDTFVDFDTGFVITDQAYGGTATYQYQGIGEYYDGSQSQPLTTATWTTTSTAGATVSGDGTSGNPLIITGSRSQVNDALANMRMIPDLDWTTSPGPNGNFYLTHLQIVRTNDQVAIAQSGITGDETGEESQLYTYFYAGTAVDAVNIPSPLSYYGDPSVLDPDGNLAAISYINNVSLEVTEETADYHGVTYSLFLYTGANPDIYSYLTQGDIGDYMDDDYVTNGYVANQVSFTQKTRSEMNLILERLRINNYSVDFQMNFYMTRSGTPGSIFDQDITFQYADFPVINVTNNKFTTAPREQVMSELDIVPYQEEVTDQNVVDYLNYTYSGSGSVFFDRYEIKSYTDSSKTTFVDSAYQFTPEIGQYIVTDEPSNSRIKVEFKYAVDDDIDTPSLYLSERFSMGVSGITANPVYRWIEGERLVAARETLLAGHYVTSWGTSSPVNLYPDYFAPVAYDNTEVSRVTAGVENNNPNTGFEIVEGRFVVGDEPFVRTIVGTAPNQWTKWLSLYWYDSLFTESWYINHPNSSYATYQTSISDPLTDHLFGATPWDDNGTKQLIFYQSNLQSTDNIETTQIQEGGPTKRIYIDTGWAADSSMVDFLFDEVNLKVYALIVNVSSRDWKLFSADCLNGLDLNIINGATQVASGTQLLSGAIGRTTTNEVFLALVSTLNYGNGQVDIYHKNTGGTNNWGLQQSIGPGDFNYEAFSETLGAPNTSIKANIRGWIALGNGLWKWNTSANQWVEYADPIRFGSSGALNERIINETARLALTPYYWVCRTGDVIALNDFTTPGSLPTPVMQMYHRDDDIPDYTTPGYTDGNNGEYKYNFNGAKHDDVFVSRTHLRTVINRLTK